MNRKDYADALMPVMTPEAWIEMAGMQKNKQKLVRLLQYMRKIILENLDIIMEI